MSVFLEEEEAICFQIAIASSITEVNGTTLSQGFVHIIVREASSDSV